MCDVVEYKYKLTPKGDVTHFTSVYHFIASNVWLAGYTTAPYPEVWAFANNKEITEIRPISGVPDFIVYIDLENISTKSSPKVYYTYNSPKIYFLLDSIQMHVGVENSGIPEQYWRYCEIMPLPIPKPFNFKILIIVLGSVLGATILSLLGYGLYRIIKK